MLLLLVVLLLMLQVIPIFVNPHKFAQHKQVSHTNAPGASITHAHTHWLNKNQQTTTTDVVMTAKHAQVHSVAYLVKQGCCHLGSPPPPPSLWPQAPALRALTPAEREVLLLLGSDVSTTQGHILIQENDRVSGDNTRLQLEPYADSSIVTDKLQLQWFEGISDLQ